MTKVFIDGSAGTTGLRIVERLSARRDLSLIILPDDKRKDPQARKEALHSADIAFLCLPDAAAVEAVALAEGSDCVIIDTSTAHRTNEAWAYGFPELSGRKEKILASKRIANPGCHASGFVALVEPLVSAGLLPADAELCCFSLTGYSGGGKNMIAEYEGEKRDPLLAAPRQYGLTQQHKHLKEMAKIASLEKLPAFSPIVAPFYSGMEVTIPLFTHHLNCEAKNAISEITEIYKKTFRGPIVSCIESTSENGFLSAGALSGKDTMEVSVYGNEDRIILVSRFDNLGKGASGAAIQNMNLILGLDETTGLAV